MLTTYSTAHTGVLSMGTVSVWDSFNVVFWLLSLVQPKITEFRGLKFPKMLECLQMRITASVTHVRKQANYHHLSRWNSYQRSPKLNSMRREEADLLPCFSDLAHVWRCCLCEVYSRWWSLKLLKLFIRCPLLWPNWHLPSSLACFRFTIVDFLCRLCCFHWLPEKTKLKVLLLQHLLTHSRAVSRITAKGNH